MATTPHPAGKNPGFAPAGETVLDRRTLNRATLSRQLLLRRAEFTVPQAVEHLVGLQAQTPHTWYLGLWSRLAEYTTDATAKLLREGGLLRMALMRGTIHLVTPGDCVWLRALVDPVIQRMTRSAFGRNLTGLDHAALAGAARELLDEQPLTFHALGLQLAERWPEYDPASMAQAVRAHVPLVQVPPRGVWGESGFAAHTTVESWLGRSVDTGPDPARLVLRYLAAFGPATVRDVQHWSGATRLAAVVEALRPQLAVFRDDEGRELFDLPDAPRPDPGTPAPVRFLYDFDNLLRSYADASRVSTVSLADQGYGGRTNRVPGTVLVDGFVAATWTVVAKRTAATLTIRPFRKLTPHEEEEVSAEGRSMLAFLEAEAESRDVVFQSPCPG